METTNTTTRKDTDLENKLYNILLLTDRALHEFQDIWGALDSSSARFIQRSLLMAHDLIEDEQQLLGDKLDRINGIS